MITAEGQLGDTASGTVHTVTTRPGLMGRWAASDPSSWDRVLADLTRARSDKLQLFVPEAAAQTTADGTVLSPDTSPAL